MRTIKKNGDLNSINDLDEFIKDFIKALFNVESRYIVYQIRGEEGENEPKIQKQYERVFAYEFYHQFRKIMESNPDRYEGIFLNGEAHKGDSIYSKVPKSMPDIILNEDPGRVVKDGQFFLCEMKTAENSKFYEDFGKLYEYKKSELNFKEYIFLSIGETIKELGDKIRKKLSENTKKLMKFDKETLCICINLGGNEVGYARLGDLLDEGKCKGYCESSNDGNNISTVQGA